jgi:hypothetical protein
MKKGKTSSLLIFVHIERCGGTTLNYSMLNNFPGVLAPKANLQISQKVTQTLSVDYEPEDLEELLDIYPWISCIGGHHTRVYQPYHKVINKPVFYFTFLRDPVDRYLSHYNYQRIAMGIDWTLDEFLDNPRFNNWQTFRIAGEYNLQKAKEYLTSEMNFTGITEKYNESLVILQQLIGIDKMDFNYAAQNTITGDKNPNKLPAVKINDLNDELKDRIIKNNRQDLELYDYALNEIFPEYLNRFKQDELTAKASRLEKSSKEFTVNRKNKVLNKLLRRYLKFRLRFSSHRFKY